LNLTLIEIVVTFFLVAGLRWFSYHYKGLRTYFSNQSRCI